MRSPQDDGTGNSPAGGGPSGGAGSGPKRSDSYGTVTKLAAVITNPKSTEVHKSIARRMVTLLV